MPRFVPLLAFVALILAGCASHGGYPRLPAADTAIDLSSAPVDTFVIEIDPAFAASSGFRYEFPPDDPARCIQTLYAPNRPARQTFLSRSETARLRTLLRAFDWNQAEDPQDPNVVRLVPDDTLVLFRARVGPAYHEVRSGLSNSTALGGLLHQLGLLK